MTAESGTGSMHGRDYSAAPAAPLGKNLHNLSAPEPSPSGDEPTTSQHGSSEGPDLHAEFRDNPRFRQFLTDLAELEARGAVDEVEHKPTKNLRRVLHRLADSYREHAISERVGKCGRVRCDPAVQISAGQNSCNFVGLIRCRTKACPVCLARRRSEYAEQILKVAELWRTGWMKTVGADPITVTVKGEPMQVYSLKQHDQVPAYLATFTVRHGWSDDLVTTGHGIRKAWARFIGGREWRKIRRDFGFEYIVAQEATHGRNGWHPHLHILFFPKRRLSVGQVLKVADFMYERWAEMVAKHIGEAHRPDPTHGTDFKQATETAEDYISKAVGLELADPGTKRGGKGGRTPIQLLKAWQETGDKQALALYRHYEKVMSGRRDLTWSAGLREYRAVAMRILEDERKAEAEAAPLVAELPGTVWDLWRQKESPHTRLLEAAERGGIEAVVELVGLECGAWASEEVRAATHRAHSETRAPPCDSAGLKEPPQVASDVDELCRFDGPDPF